MSRERLFSYLLSIFSLSLLFYTYIDWENDLTELKMELSARALSLRDMEEESSLLRWRIERLESPTRLVTLLKEREFSHLRYPLNHQVIVVDE